MAATTTTTTTTTTARRRGDNRPPGGMIEGHFDGVITNGVRDGPGKLTWTNGDTFVGEFKNGLRHGQGVYEEKKAGRR